MIKTNAHLTKVYFCIKKGYRKIVPQVIDDFQYDDLGCRTYDRKTYKPAIYWFAGSKAGKKMKLSIVNGLILLQCRLLHTISLNNSHFV
jgi:hypothetical protein